MLGQSLGQLSSIDAISVGRPLINVIAAAATINPLSKIARVTGTTAVATITPPSPYFVGPLWLYSTDATPCTTVTTGNIALATTLVQFKILHLIFDPATSKWYPSY